MSSAAGVACAGPLGRGVRRLVDKEMMKMIKQFCDVCGDEITSDNVPCSGHEGNRVAAVVEGKTGVLRVEVHTAINGIWNSGDVCKYCIIDAVSKCDDRPMPSNS